MTTETRPVMKPDFVMTQAERDAIEYIRNLPYRADNPPDYALVAKVELFLTLYGDMGRRLEASPDAVNLVYLCFQEGDYSRLDAIIPSQRAVVEAMFARAQFDCEKVD